MTEAEIEIHALLEAAVVYERRRTIPNERIDGMKAAIVVYNRERWRLESAEHESRQAHQREANVLAATAK